MNYGRDVGSRNTPLAQHGDKPMTRRRKTYRAPRNSAERIREAEQAIARLSDTINTGGNRFGEYGRNCRDAIARWQAVIDREHASRNNA
jgi:hypothetical protein